MLDLVREMADAMPDVLATTAREFTHEFGDSPAVAEIRRVVTKLCRSARARRGTS